MSGLSKRTIDTSNLDFVEHHKNRKSVDLVFCEAVMAACDLCFLEAKKTANPGVSVQHPGKLISLGFVPEGLKNPSLLIEKLLVKRFECKRAKNWKEADRIRDSLHGVTINDSADGVTYIFDDLVHPLYSYR